MRNTPNYGLPQFEPNDDFNISDFNNAYETLDKAMGDLQETFNINGSTGDLTTYEVVQARQGESSLLTNISNIKNLFCDINTFKTFVVNEDWKYAFEKAFSLGVKQIYMPKGTYKMSTLKVPSDVFIYGDGLLTTIIPLSSIVFDISGTEGNLKTLSEDIVDFSNTIRTVNVDGINKGDYVLIRGQRDCLSYADSGDEWTLGYSTPNSQGACFGEFQRVKDVSSVTNTIVLTNRLIFPFYYKDNSKETSTNARPYTTIQKDDWVENVIIKDLKIVGHCNPAISVSRGINCVIENITNIVDNYNANMGGLITFRTSYKCEGVNCVYNKVDMVAPPQHHYLNVFKIGSSQLCGFVRCKASNATQPFDISYFPLNIPSSMCYIENSVVTDALQTGMTSHGGTYKCKFTDNKIFNCLQGICNRSKEAIITNNLITGNRNSSVRLRYGIALYEGHATNCIISNNNISGFNFGLCVIDGVDEGETFTLVNSIFSNNIVTKCGIPFTIERSQYALYKDMNVVINDNIFITNGLLDKTMLLNSKTCGVIIKDNLFHSYAYGVGLDNRGIWADVNCLNITSYGNTFINFKTAQFFRGISDSNVTTPAPMYHNNNKYVNCENNAVQGSNITITRGTIEDFREITFDTKHSQLSAVKPLSFFINSEGTPSFKDANGLIKKVTLV